MNAFFGVLRWSLLGAVIAGVVTFLGFLLLNHNEILGPHDSDEVQAWARFAAVMGSLGVASGGFVIGTVYGIVRVRRR
jgi:hypothetical protein